jgi:hypothetical protein
MSSWDAEFEEELTPQLEAEILAYSQHRYEESPSFKDSQNKEEMARQMELSTEASKPFYWRKQEELAMHPSRIGRILNAGDFLLTLRNECNLQCWYTGDAALQRGLITLTVLAKEHQKPKALCGVQPGPMPEYSVMNFDCYGAPTTERFRGWRTVLLRLILNGVLSEDQVNKTFGYPEGPAGRRYREQLHGYRNRPNV